MVRKKSSMGGLMLLYRGFNSWNVWREGVAPGNILAEQKKCSQTTCSPWTMWGAPAAMRWHLDNPDKTGREPLPHAVAVTALQELDAEIAQLEPALTMLKSLRKDTVPKPTKREVGTKASTEAQRRKRNRT